MSDLLEIEREDLCELERVENAFQAVDSSVIPQEFRDRYAKLAEHTVALTLDAAANLRPRWEQMKEAGWHGHAAQVHELRGSFLRSVEARLAYLAKARRIADLAAILTDRPVPGSEKLAAAHHDVTVLMDEVFGKWTTLEDLEQILVETYPFTAEQFDTLAAQYRPPQEWFEQDENPF
jgi:hypothetical protein